MSRRFLWLVASCLVVLAPSAFASEIFTLTGSYGAIDQPSGTQITAYLGTVFTLSFTLPSNAPPGSYDSGTAVQFGFLSNITYTNDGTTVGSASTFGQLVLFPNPCAVTCPFDSGGLLLSVSNLYVAEDFFQFIVVGPQLFSGAPSSPTIPPGSFQVFQYEPSTQASIYGPNGFCCSGAALNGPVDLSIQAPEPSTLYYYIVALALLVFVSFCRRKWAPNLPRRLKWTDKLH